MKKYQIITDGSCDLPEEVTEEMGITVVPFYVSFDEQNYQKEMAEIKVRDFYQKMVEKKGVYPKSSMPSVQDYADAFLPFIKEGIAILCICITTKFSGSMQSALNAKNMLLEEYPEAEITVIDAAVNTVLQGLLVLEAADMRRKEIPYERCVREIEAIKESGRIFFTVGSIDYLQHGGRIGKLAGLAASVLGIKPLITLREGEIFPSGVSRSRKKSRERVIELLREYLEERNVKRSEYRLCIGYGYDREEAVELQKETVCALGEAYGIQEKDLPIYQIGATIAVHTGPYPLGFGILKRHGV